MKLLHDKLTFLFYLPPTKHSRLPFFMKYRNVWYEVVVPCREVAEQNKKIATPNITVN